MLGRWKRFNWFLPESVDVLGMLRAQAVVTISGCEAFSAWAAGDIESAKEVYHLEHEADGIKKSLRIGLREAFITPIGAEDIYVLSDRLDAVLNGCKNLIREAEVLAATPDVAMASMASLISEGVHDLSDAFDRLGNGVGARKGKGALAKTDDPTEAADSAIRTQRSLERVYRQAMVNLLVEGGEVTEITTRRELYRRMSRISESIIEVADRIWYAAVKEA